MPQPWRRVKEAIRRIPWIGGLAQATYLALRKELALRNEVERQLLFGVDYVYCSAVPGDVAEFGTCSGDTALTIARALADWEERDPDIVAKRFHLFDSFEGFPEFGSAIDRDCHHAKSGDWRPGSCKGLDRAQLERLLRRVLPPDELEFHEGWYRDTVPRLSAGVTFAMLHLDCDLYESTTDALDTLFARNQVAEGAVLFFDAWNCNRASPDHGQRKAWADLARKYAIEASDGGDYSWEGHKILVHRYRATQAMPPVSSVARKGTLA